MSTRRSLLGATSVWALPVRAEPKRLLLVNAEYPPFVLPPGDPQGEGMDIEIAREAMRRSGYQLEVQHFPWRRALAMLERGEADLTTTISISEERRRFLRFSVGYRTSVHYSFFSRKGDKLVLERMDQLNGVRLGLATGYFYPSAIREAPGVKVVEGRDIPTIVAMLAAGRTDCIVVNHLAGAWTIRRLGLQADMQLQPLAYTSGSPTYMAFSRARHPHDAAIDVMDRGLQLMLRDGSLSRIEKKYLTE